MTWSNRNRDTTPVDNFPDQRSDIPTQRQQPLVDLSDRNCNNSRYENRGSADNLTINDGTRIIKIGHVDNLYVNSGDMDRGVVGRRPHCYQSNQAAYDSESRAYQRSCEVAAFQTQMRMMGPRRFEREGCYDDRGYSRRDDYDLIGADRGWDRGYRHRGGNSFGDGLRDVNRNVISPIVQTLGLVLGGKMMIDGIRGKGWASNLGNGGWNGGWDRGYNDYDLIGANNGWSWNHTPSYSNPRWNDYSQNGYDIYDNGYRSGSYYRRPSYRPNLSLRLFG